MVSGDCLKVAILVQPPLLSRSAPLGTAIVAPCQYIFNTRTSAMGKTSAAPKTSKNTTAWWPASHWKKLAMKCQISIEKSQIFPNSNLDRLQKLSATYNFAASLFCTQSPFKIILRPASWWLSQSCHSCAAVVAVKIWAQMGHRLKVF